MIDKKIFELDLCCEMLYESPIKIMAQDVQFQMENDVMKAVQRYGIYVDKKELIKALEYDRGQYEKGFRDGSKVNKWIPCSERLPEEDGKYLVSTDGTFGIDVIDIARFENDEWFKSCKIIAWQPLPEPYKEGET